MRMHRRKQSRKQKFCSALSVVGLLEVKVRKSAHVKKSSRVRRAKKRAPRFPQSLCCRPINFELGTLELGSEMISCVLTYPVQSIKYCQNLQRLLWAINLAINWKFYLLTCQLEQAPQTDLGQGLASCPQFLSPRLFLPNQAMGQTKGHSYPELRPWK